MGIFSKSGGGAKDPRDQVGQNPTGRERKSSAGKRRQAAAREEKPGNQADRNGRK